MNRLNTELRDEAIANGLCNQWQDEWRSDCTLQELADKMYKGLDFCIEHHYPSCDYMKDNFPLDFRRKNGVLVDDKYSLLNPKRALLRGKSQSNIRFNARNMATIYVCDESSAHITVKNNARVIVSVHDNASVYVEATEMNHVLVIRHSREAKVKVSGDVRIAERFSE